MSSFTPLGFSSYSTPGGLSTKVRPCQNGLQGPTCFGTLLDNTLTSTAAATATLPVTTSELADGAVTSAKLADGAVAPSKLLLFPSYPTTFWQRYAVSDEFDSVTVAFQATNRYGADLTFSGDDADKMQVWVGFQNDEGISLTSTFTSTAFEPQAVEYLSVPNGVVEPNGTMRWEFNLANLWYEQPSTAVTYSLAFRYVTDELGTTGLAQAPPFSLAMTTYTAAAPSISQSSFTNQSPGSFSVVVNGTLLRTGGAPITNYGFCWSTVNPPTIADNTTPNATTTTGTFSLEVSIESPLSTTLYGRLFATNAFGTTYASTTNTFEIFICLAEGTRVMLASGQTKAIEDVGYDDDVAAWDFDTGCLTSAKPVWIAKPGKASWYNKLTFSDGTVLRTIHQHRVFCKETGAFTYPMPYGSYGSYGSHEKQDDMPIGSTSVVLDTKSGGLKETTLIKKEIVKEEVGSYNLMTNYHINLFGDGVLTSGRYSNVYPVDTHKMTYTKQTRTRHNIDDFVGIPRALVDGLRLTEQPGDLQAMRQHLAMMTANQL